MNSTPSDIELALADEPRARATELLEVWHRLGEVEPQLPDGVPPPEAALADLESRIERPRAQRADRAPVRSRRTSAAAATLVAGAVVVAAVLVWMLHRPAVVITSPGEFVSMELPDGSQLQIGADSEVRYQRNFRAWPFRSAEVRGVHLRGEAYFEVVTAATPFVVTTHDARVEVLGTSFNVRARAEDTVGGTRVSVGEGSVRLGSLLAEEPGVIIHAGQSSTITGNAPAAPAVEPIERVAAWRHGGFTIHEMPLGDVLREVERRFAVRIERGEGVSADVPLTLFYGRTVDAETVIHDIALATDLRYRPLRGGFELVRPDPR